MAIDWQAIADAGGIGKGTPSALNRHRKQSKADAKLQAAYRGVDARDGSVCWVTGVKTSPGAVNAKRRREHHHLAGRRVKPEWRHDANRIITVSAFVHDLLTTSALKADGADARKAIVFSWNRRIVKPGKEPFHLKEPSC